MNKIIIIKTFCVLVFALFAFSAVSAAPLAETKTTSGTVGGITVFAEKGLNIGTNTFSAYVWSRAVTSIGTIGYTWWTVREYCPSLGTYPVNQQYPGQAAFSTDSYYDAMNTYRDNCSGTSQQFQNLGVHDFKQGTSVYRPQVDLYVNR